MKKKIKIILIITAFLISSCASVPTWERGPLNNDREIKLLNPHKGVYADKDLFYLITSVAFGAALILLVGPNKL
tara:strand:+ start:862 stop:1083 length:222 start_codon:yes stop_codon:yes gene_type:complete